MRIYTIQPFAENHTISKKTKKIAKMYPTTGYNLDTVSFSGNEVKKGFGIGAVIGIAALSILSGGLATPLAYGAYAATMGAAGGMLGNAIKESNNNNNDNKKP